jgi:hypothetical protein
MSAGEMDAGALDVFAVASVSVSLANGNANKPLDFSVALIAEG